MQRCRNCDIFCPFVFINIHRNTFIFACFFRFLGRLDMEYHNSFAISNIEPFWAGLDFLLPWLRPLLFKHIHRRSEFSTGTSKATRRAGDGARDSCACPPIFFSLSQSAIAVKRNLVKSCRLAEHPWLALPKTGACQPRLTFSLTTQLLGFI